MVILKGPCAVAKEDYADPVSEVGVELKSWRPRAVKVISLAVLFIF